MSRAVPASPATPSMRPPRAHKATSVSRTDAGRYRAATCARRWLGCCGNDAAADTAVGKSARGRGNTGFGPARCITASRNERAARRVASLSGCGSTRLAGTSSRSTMPSISTP